MHVKIKGNRRVKMQYQTSYRMVCIPRLTSLSCSFAAIFFFLKSSNCKLNLWTSCIDRLPKRGLCVVFSSCFTAIRCEDLMTVLHTQSQRNTAAYVSHLSQVSPHWVYQWNKVLQPYHHIFLYVFVYTIQCVLSFSLRQYGVIKGISLLFLVDQVTT